MRKNALFAASYKKKTRTHYRSSIFYVGACSYIERSAVFLYAKSSGFLRKEMIYNVIEKNKLRATPLTKEKIKHVLRRLPYVLEMLNEGKTEAYFYISKRMEKVVIDEEVRAIVEILDEIISREDALWLKKIFLRVRKGNKDIYIMMDSPIGRGKYYLIKAQLVDKIYDCCIYRGFVSYEDILNERMG